MTTESQEQGLIKRDTIEMGILHATDARALVHGATVIAKELSAIIEQQKLYSMISGRKYVKCEGWTTLAAMLGVVPREVSNVELEDGSFEAVVELVRIKDGQMIGRASAYCGMDESTWKSRAKYARRSMAATRATGKACRLAFSCIMALAGFEVTPAEEIPDDERQNKASSQTKGKTAAVKAKAKPETDGQETATPKQRADLYSLAENEALEQKARDFILDVLADDEKPLRKSVAQEMITRAQAKLLMTDEKIPEI